jgi:hypothetical protein
MNWHKHYKSVKTRKNIQCCQLNFFECSPYKQILFHNFFVFPLFCPPSVYLGVQAAEYVHWAAHNLNLALNDYVQNISEIIFNNVGRIL